MDEPLISEYSADPEMVELIGEFIASLAETCQQLRERVASEDIVGIRRIGHQMKGAGAGYGYPVLTAVGAALEKAVDADSVVSDTVRRQAELFCQMCDRARSSTAAPGT